MALFKIPSLILKQLYTFGSLENVRRRRPVRDQEPALRCHVSPACRRSRIDGHEVPIAKVMVDLGDGLKTAATAVSESSPLAFALKKTVILECGGVEPLAKGEHDLAIGFRATPFGELTVKVKDSIAEQKHQRITVPLDKDEQLHARDRQAPARSSSRSTPASSSQHIDKPSYAASVTAGNIENFTGVAQVPIGFAGPLQVNGEHAQGEFLIPLATAEGTLVASYNRGMKVLNLSGGVICTVVDDCMQRAPVFVFDSAREARDFAHWVADRRTSTRSAREAEATSSVAKLLYIDTYLAAKFAYLRFNFSTGDAAGQNMVGRATFAACSWILEQPWVKEHCRRFYLESNFATDKKASQVNIMRTRGKRVVAECTIPRDVLIAAHAGRAREAPLPRPGRQRRRLPLGRQQQRRPLAQRHHRDVHRHRPGRRQRRGVLGGDRLHRADAEAATSTSRSPSRR